MCCTEARLPGPEVLTVTVAAAVTVPPAPVAVAVYVVVVVGVTVAVPESPREELEIDGETLKEVAFVVDHVNVADCPELIAVVGETVNVTVGAGLLGGGGVCVLDELPPQAISPISRAAQKAKLTLRKKCTFILKTPGDG